MSPSPARKGLDSLPGTKTRHREPVPLNLPR